MKRTIVIILSALIITVSFGQNLVINPSFEDIISCPTDFTQLHTCAVGWPININSVDLYHSCSSSNVSVPHNFVGYQTPLTGNAYGGFIAWLPYPDAPIEIMGAELSSPLIPGYCCYVSFNVSLASGDVNNLCVCGVDKLGALFTNVNYGFVTYPAVGTPPVIQNYAHVYTNSLILDTTGWTNISGTFIADSAYQYIMLGRFFNTNVPTDSCWDISQPNRMAYYYIDDVTVIQSPPMVISLTPENTACDADTGAISLAISGGIPPYTYLWSNGAITQNISDLTPGQYSVTVTDSIGCEIISQVDIIGSTITATLTPANIVCNGATGAISLTVSGGVPPYTYLWSNGATSQNLSNLTAGSYIVTVTDSMGCQVVDQVEITEGTIITTLALTNAVCYNEASGAINLDVSGGVSPYTFLWSNGATIQNLSNLTAGIYSVTVTDANSCSSAQSITLVETSEINISVSDTNVILCEGQSLELIASANGGTAPLSFFWNGVPGDSTLNAGPVSDTTYQVYVTDANGCTSPVEDITINYFPYLTFNLISNDTLVCSGQAVTISADIDNGLPPYTIINAGDTIASPVVIYPSLDTILTISVLDQCGNVVTDDIRINIIPAIDFSADTLAGCVPLTVQFYENSPDVGQSYLWNFGDNSSNNISYSANPSHTYTSAGVYDLSLSVDYIQGCTYHQEIFDAVNVFPSPDANFDISPNIVSSIEPEIFFNNLSTGAINYLWLFGDGDSSNAFCTYHTYPLYLSGEYRVMLVAFSENSCPDTAYQDVLIYNEHTFYAPTAFSPDNDGINDVFYVKGTGIDNNHFKLLIYNRWGEIIYESEDIYEGWNGRINGSKVEIGVYTWLAIYKTNNSQEHRESGVVNVIR